MASFKQLEGIREDMSPNAGQLQLGLVTAEERERISIRTLSLATAVKSLSSRKKYKRRKKKYQS